jgi:hypothetical protein
MPSGENVEIAEPEDFLPFLFALLLAAPRALTFLLFFTRLPSSFEDPGAANRRRIQVNPLATLPRIRQLSMRKRVISDSFSACCGREQFTFCASQPKLNWRARLVPMSSSAGLSSGFLS